MLGGGLGGDGKAPEVGDLDTTHRDLLGLVLGEMLGVGLFPRPGFVGFTTSRILDCAARSHELDS